MRLSPGHSTQGLFLGTLVLLLFLWAVPCPAAVAAVPLYNCPTVPQDPGGCDAGCQQDIGNALLSLHAGLAGPHGQNTPWYKRTPLTLCQGHCYELPHFCGWPSVLCCLGKARPRADERFDGACERDVEDVRCPRGAAAGSVWKLDFSMHNLGGRLSDGVVDGLKVLTKYGLNAVDFSSNNLTGTIPERLPELGRNLTTLNLNFNKLTGTVPRSLGKMPNLKHLFLSFNKLNGSLAGRLCTREPDPLEVLVLRSNWLSGPVNLRACRHLQLLDLADNFLTGTLPVGLHNNGLISFRASNNKFSGSISDDIWKLPLLSTIDFSNNDLNGSLSEFTGSNNNLVSLYLGNNSLSGTIPMGVVENSQLLILELQNNTELHGTFPSAGALVGLRRLLLFNTSISGRIPDEWGKLPYLETVDISNTRMSCCSTQQEADNATSDPNQLLPSYLEFSGRLQQFDLSSASAGGRVVERNEANQPNNILCGTVVRKWQPESVWNTLQRPVTNNVVELQQWIMSPTYFWFQNCTCTKFYEMTSSRYTYEGVRHWCPANSSTNSSADTGVGPCLDMSIFSCEPLDHSRLPPSARAGVAVAAFLTALVVISLIAYLMLAKASKFRRYLILNANRLKGAPRFGRMSLVVTDIEGYSDMFRRSPEDMYKALVLHNTVLRAAKYSNGGFVLEQEGDSFTLAFYSPFDAVVFCLQAQQALLRVQWPPGLEQAQEPESYTHLDSVTTRKGSKLHMRLSPLLNFGPKFRKTPTNTSTRSLGSQLDFAPSAISTALHGLGGSRTQLEEGVLFNGLRVRMGVVTGDVPSGTPIKNSALFQLAKVVGDFGNGGQIILDEATFAATKDDAQALGAVDASGLNHSKLSSGRSLRTRLLRLCGFAAEYLPAEEVVLLDMGAFCQAPADDSPELPYTTSRPLDVKPPEDQQQQQQQAAKGSCWSSCSPCCSRKEEESGSEFSESPMQNMSRAGLPPAAQASRPFLGSTASQAGHSTGRTDSGGSGAAASRGLLSSITMREQHSQHSPGGSPRRQDPAVAPVGRLASFSARATRQWGELRKTLAQSTSLQGQQSYRRDWESVRLYQVLPPTLAARAHVWHNQLNVKAGWICWDNIYFEAPGSTLAPLTGGSVTVFGSGNSYSQHPINSQVHMNSCLQQPVSPPAAAALSPAAPSSGAVAAAAGPITEDLSLQVQPTGDSGSSSLTVQPTGHSRIGPLLQQPLPPVTMVFMAVEGPEQLVRRRRSFTPVVQGLLCRVVRDALRRLGGYLCRVQEGDMKFMVVFADPVTALEWCLLVQSAAMYLPWPQSAIMLLPSCREQVDSTGRLVFRGPRIKMGVCEGVPRTILPDHEGRADYHGQSINMAARFMTKGAKGGQIACTRELAQQALSVWAAGGGSSSYRDPRGGGYCTQSIAEDDTAAAAAAAAADDAGTIAASSITVGGLQDDSSSVQRQRDSAAHGDQYHTPSPALLVQSHPLDLSNPTNPKQEHNSSSGNSKRPSWWGAAAFAAAAGNGAAASAAAAAAPPAAAPGEAATAASAAGPPAAVNKGTPFGPLSFLQSFKSTGASSAADSSNDLRTAASTAATAAAAAVAEGPGRHCMEPSFSDSVNTPSAAAAARESHSGSLPAQPSEGSLLQDTASGPQQPAATSRLGQEGVGAGVEAAQQAHPAAGPAAAAAAGLASPSKTARSSWPGLSTTSQQQDQQQQDQMQQQASGTSWLGRIRASHDGSSSSPHSKLWRAAMRTKSTSRAASAPGQQQQPPTRLTASSSEPNIAPADSGRLSRSGAAAAVLPPAVAPSPFVMKDVLRVPFRVEVQRLGMFSFKGGPPQQEMVQVVPTHLLGRAEFISYDAGQSTSRKGQMLQRLEGRVGEQVMVQLPALAQEYHEKLGSRLPGTTGLPHMSLGTTAAPAAVRQRSVTGAQLGQPGAWGRGNSSSWRGSQSVTLPVGGTLWAARPAAAGAAAGAAAAGAAAAAAAAGPEAAAGVHGQEAQGVELVQSRPHSCTAAPGQPLAAGDAASEPLHALNGLQQAAPGVAQGGSSSSHVGSSTTQQQPQQQQQQQQMEQASPAGVAHQGPHKASRVSAGSAARGTATAAAAADHIVDLQDLAYRHDSFRSVDDVAAAANGGDLELGLAPAAGAAQPGPRSKSDPEMLQRSRFGGSRASQQ